MNTIQQPLPTLEALYQDHKGYVSVKWRSFLATYDEIFAPYRTQPIAMLELGVQNGGSLSIWAKYFQQAELIVGCDIDEKCHALSYEDPRVKLEIGDVNTQVTYQSLLKHAKDYQIIIDDASHQSGDIIRTFAKLFPHVEDGGLYIVEDIHACYLQAYDGGLYDPLSAITFFKYCADLINYQHWGTAHKRSELFGEGFAKKYGISFDEEVLACVASVTFVQSMCIIKKASKKLDTLYVAGQSETVSQGHLSLHGKQIPTPSQADNIWSEQVQLDQAFLASLSDQVKSQSLQMQEDAVQLQYRQEVIQQLKDYSEGLGRENQKLSNELNLLKSQLESIKADIAQTTQLKKTVEQLAAENTLLAESERKHIKLYNNVLSTTSWRLTRPLRALVTHAKRLFGQ